jgi:hypothetical protein
MTSQFVIDRCRNLVNLAAQGGRGVASFRLAPNLELLLHGGGKNETPIIFHCEPPRKILGRPYTVGALAHGTIVAHTVHKVALTKETPS